MKKLGLSLLVLLAAAAPGWPQAPAPAPGRTPEPRPSPSFKMHKIEAEVVSTDLAKETITFKAEGGEKTSPVGVLATARLKRLKPGDQVILTCTDDPASGEHRKVVFIRMTTPDAAPPEKK